MTAGSETLRRRDLGSGKSKTCRASEWQSHWVGRIIKLQLRGQAFDSAILNPQSRLFKTKLDRILTTNESRLELGDLHLRCRCISCEERPLRGAKFLCRTIKRAIVSRPFSFCPPGILTCPEDKDHGPNRWRYSLDVIKALTMSALLKSPLNEFSLASQN
jgi:hypothetical protein